jgi:pilus assembly protein Flp/PilA
MWWFFWRSRGQSLIEYSLIIALVVVVVLGAIILLGPQISSAFRNIENNI